jgi:hypothetical protein
MSWRAFICCFRDVWERAHLPTATYEHDLKEGTEDSVVMLLCYEVLEYA